MVFNAFLCNLVLWTKVASALQELSDVVTVQDSGAAWPGIQCGGTSI